MYLNPNMAVFHVNTVFAPHPQSSVIFIYTSALPPLYTLWFYLLSRVKSKVGGMQV